MHYVMPRCYETHFEHKRTFTPLVLGTTNCAFDFLMVELNIFKYFPFAGVLQTAGTLCVKN